MFSGREADTPKLIAEAEWLGKRMDRTRQEAFWTPDKRIMTDQPNISFLSAWPNARMHFSFDFLLNNDNTPIV